MDSFHTADGRALAYRREAYVEYLDAERPNHDALHLFNTESLVVRRGA